MAENQYSIRISVKEKMQLMGNLSTMLKAGIPILEAVESLLEEAKGGKQKVLQTMKEDLQAGNKINKSLSRYPKSFDKVTVSLIRAAEKAGNLEVTLKDVQQGLQRDMEFSDKIKSALMYPAFVLLVFVGVLLMMLIVVMPRISQVFSRLRMDLPLPTRILIKSSNLLINHYWFIGGGLIAIIAVGVLFYKHNRRLLANILFSLPFLSGMRRQIDLTRFSRSLALLLGSGLPIVVALELAEDVVLKNDLHQLLTRARERVSAGDKFSEGLRSEGKLVPGIVIKLIEVGERTGSLDESMVEVTEMLDYKVSKTLKTATSLLEPIMLVAVALSVGAMMLAIIGPIYGMISDVNMAAGSGL